MAKEIFIYFIKNSPLYKSLHFRGLLSQLSHFEGKGICTNQFFYNKVISNSPLEKTALDKDIVESGNEVNEINKIRNKITKSFGFSGKEITDSMVNYIGCLETVNTISELKKVIESHPNLNVPEILETYSQIKYLIKKTRLTPTFKDDWADFGRSNEFLKLSTALNKYLPVLSPFDLILTLQVCACCKVSGKSILVKKILKLLLEHINHFQNLGEFLFIYVTVASFFEKTALAEAVKEACLFKLLQCLEMHCDLEEAKSAINFFTNDCLPLFLRQKLFTVISSVSLESFSLNEFQKLLFGLRKTKYNLDKTFESYLLNCLCYKMKYEWVDQDPKSLISDYCKAVQNGHLLYDKSLCYFMGSYILQTKLPLGGIIRNCESLVSEALHINYSLLDQIMSQALMNSEQLNESDLAHLIIIIAQTGFHNKKDTNCDFVGPKLMSSSVLKLPFLKGIFQTRLALSMVILNLCRDDVIEKSLFSDNLCNVFCKVNNTGVIQAWYTILLENWVKVFYPNYKGQYISDDIYPIIKNLADTLVSWEWKVIVNSALGGENFVLTNCTTALKHVLNYVVVLGHDNKPIDLSCYKKEKNLAIEDITLPQGSRIVVIQEFGQDLGPYFRNVPILHGFVDLYINVLEALGCVVVPLSKEYINEVIDFERETFILREIENKCGTVKVE